MSVREKFVERFGEADAAAVEAAAAEHSNGINSKRKGSDEFRWALAIAIGYQCMEIDRHRKHHGITAPWSDLDAWIVSDGDLANHDGDSDYLALFAGAYNKYAQKGSATK